jgi:hypothetical protein
MLQKLRSCSSFPGLKDQLEAAEGDAGAGLSLTQECPTTDLDLTCMVVLETAIGETEAPSTRRP